MIDVSSLCTQLCELSLNSSSPFIVAIDGRSGAGKSTLAKAIATELQAVVLQGDDFFAGGKQVSADDAKTLAERCIDRESLIVVLRQLLAGNSANYFPFDWEAFDESRSSVAETVEPRSLIILEGVYTAHPDLADFLSYRILLNTPEEERLRRLLLREGQISEWEQQWHRAEEWYFTNLATTETFDLIFSI